MILSSIKNIGCKLQTVLLIFFCSLCILSIISCSGKHADKKKYSNKQGYKPSILLFPLQNLTPVSDESLNNQFFQKFITTLTKQCKSAHLIKTDETEHAPIPMLETGLVDSLRLASAGSRDGLSALINTSIINVELWKDLRSSLISRGGKNKARIEICTEIYDTVTGATIFNQCEKKEIKLDSKQVDKLTEQDLTSLPEFSEALNELARKNGCQICDILKKMPWNTFISTVYDKGNHVTLSAGSNSGIKTGDAFDVYERNNITTGKGGQRFFIPGRKVGSIVVSSTTGKKATATVVFGQGYIKPNYLVRP